MGGGGRGPYSKWSYFQFNTLSFMKNDFKDILTGSIWIDTRTQIHPFLWYPQNHKYFDSHRDCIPCLHKLHPTIYILFKSSKTCTHSDIHCTIFMFDILGKYNYLKYQNKTIFIPFLKLVNIRYVWIKFEFNYFSLNWTFTIKRHVSMLKASNNSGGF